jgi:hypothetical protein
MSVLKNPVFFISCILFWFNQILERGFEVYIPYIHSYLDDLLAMPVILGITLQVYRWIHPLKDKFVFTKIHIIVGVAYFSILFEVLLPLWSPIYTADWFDILCYIFGALVFYRFINVPKAN